MFCFLMRREYLLSKVFKMPMYMPNIPRSWFLQEYWRRERIALIRTVSVGIGHLMREKWGLQF